MARGFTKDAQDIIEKHEQIMQQIKLMEKPEHNYERQIENAYARACAANAFIEAGRELVNSGALVEQNSWIGDIIKQLYSHLVSKELTDECDQIIRDYQHQAARSIAALKANMGVLKRLFSQKSKQEAAGAFEYLSSEEALNYENVIHDLNERIKRHKHCETKDVLSDFLRRRTLYCNTLDKLTHGGSIPDDTKNLCDDHEKLLEEIGAALNMDDETEDKIKAAAERMIATELIKKLSSISIDELSKIEKGLPLKRLRDAGKTTIADIYTESEYGLASIYGISDTLAWGLKGYARSIANDYRQDVRIKLSYDNRTPESTELVKTIYWYIKRRLYIEKLNCLQAEYSSKINRSISFLRAESIGLTWLCSDESRIQKFFEASDELQALMNGEYVRSAKELIGLAKGSRIKDQDAWDDFAANSIVYFNILEKLVPDAIGTSDTNYGLPEKLAREIQDEDFFPQGLLCDLRAYQEWGVKYILHQGRVLLGDEMGLGKTVQAIAAMVSLRNTGATHFMVVCPASVLPNWCKEVVGKSKLRATRIYGKDRLAAFNEWQANGGVAVTNYETTAHLKPNSKFKLDMIIVDEAHYIKNTEATRTINVSALASRAERILFMTGTALENKVEEMISLITMLNKTVAAKLDSVAHIASAPKFRNLVAPVYYRRKREDVLTELPDLIEKQEWCEMTPEEESHYEYTVMHDHYMTVRRVSWNAGIEYSSKAKRLKEIVNEAMQDGRKIIVFSYFLDTIQRVREMLGSKICMETINGSVSVQKRQEIIDEFDAAPSGTVLPAQIQSGGTGLNIQSASVVVICEPQLKPSIENQAISRAYRMGQARSVIVHRLLCENSIDERIMDLLAEKQAVFNAFADQSVAAKATPIDQVVIDEKSIGKIIQEEIERIKEKNGDGK